MPKKADAEVGAVELDATNHQYGISLSPVRR